MAQHDPPKLPSDERQRRNQAQRITNIGQQISGAIRDLSSHVSAIYDHIKTSNKEPDGNESKYQTQSLLYTKRAAISAGVFSFVSLILSGLTLAILNNQLRAMRNDQRAWINISVSFPQITEIAEGKPMRGIVYMVNTGKTPAKRVSQYFVIQTIPVNRPPTLKYPESNRPNISAGIVVPTVPPDQNPAPVIGAQLLTKQEVDDLKSGKSYVAVFGKTAYFDINDIPRWVNYCYIFAYVPMLQTNSRVCTDYNDIDNN